MRTLLLALSFVLAPVCALQVSAQVSSPSASLEEGSGPLAITNSQPLKGVPVGTVLPYIGPLDVLPSDWLPCDGRTVSDRKSPLHGVQLPNLNDDRFLMGVETSDRVGIAGGSSSITQGGLHGHSGTTSGRIREQSGTPRRLVNSGDRTFQHTHQLQLQRDGGHNHGGENRPQYYGVRFIVRVK